MGRATTNQTSPTVPDEIEYDSFPPGIFLPTEGAEIVGTFVRASLTPEDYPTVADYGRCVIVEFEAIRGTGVESRGGQVEIFPGEVYSLWLTSQTLHDGFIEANPTPGEMFAVKNFGTKVSRNRKDAKGGEPVEYALYRVAMPERPKVAKESLSFADIALKGKNAGPKAS